MCYLNAAAMLVDIFLNRWYNMQSALQSTQQTHNIYLTFLHNLPIGPTLYKIDKCLLFAG